MSDQCKTKCGFSTVVELSGGRSVILFDARLTGLRVQFDRLAPKVRFDARKACRVEIRQLAPCGQFDLQPQV